MEGSLHFCVTLDFVKGGVEGCGVGSVGGVVGDEGGGRSIEPVDATSGEYEYTLHTTKPSSVHLMSCCLITSLLFFIHVFLVGTQLDR